MEKQINFILPGFYEHFKLYSNILSYIKEKPEVVREHANIYGFYGNFPFCTWDGGRIFPNYRPANIEQMEEILDVYNNKYNKPVRFVFTNSLIKETDTLDRYNNVSVELFNNGKNEIVINSPILMDYIKDNYKNYKFISSTTKCILNEDTLKEELNNPDYLMVCLDYNLNHNEKLFNSLTEQEKEKVELLINPICGPACPHRKKHYKLNSLFSLQYGKRYSMRGCLIDNNNNFWPKDWATIIKPDEIYDHYAKQGFRYFKIEGRTWPDITILLTVASYLIKPEYQNAFIDDIYNVIYKTM